MVLGLTAALLTAPSGASTSAAGRTVQGVTKKAIEIVVIVPDLDSLRAKGISVSDQTTADLVDQEWRGYVDAFGPINGRKIVLKTVGWDPIDATSFDKACVEATQDNHPFVVLNGTGFQMSSVSCISVDNDTPFISGDMAYGALLEASGKNLLTLGLPSEVAATGAVELIVENDAIPQTAKIGIISNNIPEVKAAGDTLESELEKNGFDVVSKVEVNGLAADLGLLNRETAAAATTFQAAGVDTVFNTQSFTQTGSFFSEVKKNNLGFKVFAIDGQANTCTPVSVMRGPSSGAGTTCITAWDARVATTGDSIKPDSAFEAKCREQFDGARPLPSLPGGGNGVFETDGVKYQQDLVANECTIVNLLLPAIEKAGKNVTWEKVYKNLLATKKGPAAFLSEGEGGFGKNKLYFANSLMHFTVLVAPTAKTPDANGLYDGCGIPAPCWVSQEVNGQEWFPISGKPKL
jgi:hypothetical protein